MRSRSGSFAAAVAAALLLATPAAGQRPSGPADLETSASFVLRGIEDVDVVAALGDVDGDGRRDAAVAEDDGDTVRVLLSGEGAPGTRGFRIAGTDVEDLVTPEDAGDVNGDGLADVVVPVGQGEFDDYEDGGRAVVVFGRRAPQDVDLRRPEQRDLTIELPTGEGEVAGAGDVNGDGLDDLVAGNGFEGAEEEDEDARPSSAIVFGTRELRGTRDVERLGANGFRIVGARADALFGSSVASAGDVDGDGLGDVVIGSPITLPEDFESIDEEDVDAELIASLQRGRAYIVYGRRERTTADVTRAGTATRLDSTRPTSLGFAVAGARDVNGDGLGDVAVSAPGLSLVLPFTQERGAAYVVFGGRSRPAALNADALGDRGFAVQGRRGTAATGLSLAAAGDQDGDGRADLLVGELGVDDLTALSLDEAQAPGAVQLVYGSASGATVDLAAPGDRALTLRGSGGDTAGVSVAGGSDLDRDGRGEILVARPGACRVGRLAEGDAVGFAVGAPAAGRAGRGTNGPDTLTGGPVGESLFGFGGDDLLQGRDGHDCVFGGDGADRLRGGLTGDVLFGELGADDLRGDSGCDRIFGGDEADLIVAGPARVSVVAAMRDPIGARDRDDVKGGGGDDRITGGLDRDEIDGDAGDDRLDGGSAGDDLEGNDGLDRLAGGAGADRLEGGQGRDRLTGASGNDTLVGGAEDEDYDFDAEELLSQIAPQPSDADLLDGGSGRDRLQGDEGADRLFGRTGADRLSGGDGRDLLSGGAGADVLDGDAGSDRLLAGAGNDRVDSVDRSADVVRCGTGRDSARVDRRDRVVGCERVRRVRGPRARRDSGRRPLALRAADTVARSVSSFGRR
jgi:Ca2+-binding RTX toxin-like protein